MTSPCSVASPPDPHRPRAARPPWRWSTGSAVPVAAVALLAWGALMAGCGQKGPLVPPKPPAAASAKPAASAAATASPATTPPASR